MKTSDTQSSECPYCHAPVVADDDGVNGIRPASGHGCEFCDPDPVEVG